MTAGSTQTRTPTVLGESEGEALWFNNDLLTIKATGARRAEFFLVVEELARGGKVTPLHAHPEEAGDVLRPRGRGAVPPRRPRADADAPGDSSRYRLACPTPTSRPRSAFRSLILVTPGDGAMEAFFREAGEPARERALPCRRRSTSSRSDAPPSARRR